MPRKYSKRTVRKKKPYMARRRYKRRSRTTTVVRARGPVAPRTIVRLKYDQSFTITTPVFDQIFRLNSTFDPDFTGTGHQPYGRDTYASLYNRYRVFAVSYHLDVVNVSSGGYKVTVWADNDAVPTTNASLAAEYPSAVTKTVAPTEKVYFRGKYYLPNITGVTKTQYMTDDRFQALATTSPAESICQHIAASNFSDAAPTAGQVYFNLRLIMHCEWFDPLDLGQS